MKNNRLYKRINNMITKQKLSKLFLIVAIGLGFIAAVIIGYMYITGVYEQHTKATAIMTLNYENSSAGLNPDNSKFNLRFLKGEEVLNKALSATNMEMHITTTELASYIKIKGVSSKPIDVNAETKYIDSTYKITLDLPKEYSKIIDAEQMLVAICESYQQWFISSYVVDSKALDINTDDFENMDYSTISSYFDLMALRGKHYLTIKEESTTAFIGSDGTTWKSLNQELSNLTEYDIATFNQYIWENGIAKDKEQAILSLKQKNKDLYADYDLYMANAEEYGKAVENYRNEMTSSVLIPTYDASGEFYMSRTKTGIDSISKSMDQSLGDATNIKEKIDLNSDKINKLENSEVTDTEKADIMLENIQNKIMNIFKRIKKLDAEYVSEKTSGYVQYELVD